MTETSPRVEFRAVSLRRAGQPLFEDLSLCLGEARIGLVGDNGSGKSSLLRLIAGLLRPDCGEVLVEGRSTAAERPRTGFLFQNPDHQILFPTVGEEVAFGFMENGLDRAAAHARACRLLEDHGCRGWEKRAVHELSEGQKQLVCLIAVLAADPRILLLDEPFASLDLRTRHDLRDRLSGVSQTVVMASHDLDLLSGFDRVIWLENGRLRGDGAPNAVLAAYEATARSATSRVKSA